MALAHIDAYGQKQQVLCVSRAHTHTHDAPIHAAGLYTFPNTIELRLKRHSKRNFNVSFIHSGDHTCVYEYIAFQWDLVASYKFDYGIDCFIICISDNRECAQYTEYLSGQLGLIIISAVKREAWNRCKWQRYFAPPLPAFEFVNEIIISSWVWWCIVSNIASVAICVNFATFDFFHFVSARIRSNWIELPVLSEGGGGGDGKQSEQVLKI